MIFKKNRSRQSKIKVATIETLLNCRCGGQAGKPVALVDCENRWIIKCQVQQCYAYNIGQGLAETIQGWNRLSTHFYR